MSKHLANNGISDLMKRATLVGDFYESNVGKHPLHERLNDDWSNMANTLKDNELKIYFILDRYVYTKNDEKEIEFDSGFYTKTYDLTFSKDGYQFFHRYAMRLMSLHTLILGDLLPFVAIGLWKHSMISYPLMKSPPDEFRLFGIRNRWKYLTNDFEIIEKNIKYKSPLQTALIWYTLAKLSKTHLETFMNMYRCIEVLSAEFHQSTEEKLHRFVKDELNMFDQKVIQNKFRIPATQKVKSYLKSQYIESGKVEKILGFRNKIAHGEEYALEWNKNLRYTIEEMEEIILIIINQKIKKMRIKDFKNPSFSNDYTLLIYKSKRKIVLIDDDEFECYPNDYDICIVVGRLTDEDELLEYIQDRLKKEKIVNGQICKRLIENFGQVIDY